MTKETDKLPDNDKTRRPCGGRVIAIAGAGENLLTSHAHPKPVWNFEKRWMR